MSALGADVYGLSIPQAFTSGPYKITVQKSREEDTGIPGTKQLVMRFAVNGPAEESDLTLLDREGLEKRLGAPGEQATWRWIDAGESISLEGKGRHDPCICPRVVPVVEAMIALTLVDSLMLQKMIRD